MGSCEWDNGYSTDRNGPGELDQIAGSDVELGKERCETIDRSVDTVICSCGIIPLEKLLWKEYRRLTIKKFSVVEDHDRPVCSGSSCGVSKTFKTAETDIHSLEFPSLGEANSVIESETDSLMR